MDDLQRQVQEAIDRLVESGTERGVQVAVYRDGRQVVDAVAGVADPASGRPVDPGTVFYNFSIVKGATATIAHLLAERGLFGYDTPVAELWPEFAAHGKQAVTVRQVLDHTAGVPGVPLDTTIEDLCDWDKICAAIADTELWWEPGTKVGYHAYTFGYIVGEVVRRATGKPISQLLAEEVAGPLGVAGELWFGMPASEQHRLAPLEDEPGAAEQAAQMMASLPPDLPMFKAAPPSCSPTPPSATGPTPWPPTSRPGARPRPGPSPACTPPCSARSTASGCSPPERLAEATAVSSSGTDEVFGMPTTWGLGYAIGGPGPTRRARRRCSGTAGSAAASPAATPPAGSPGR
jgi:CubicO group peptidase (beta-lactamase class C family)